MARLINITAMPPVELEFTERCTIGREASCDFRIDDNLLSRRHAEITREGERYVIVDLDSTHGSYIDGTRVERHDLKNGDQIVLGRSKLVFESDEETTSEVMLALDRVVVAAHDPFVQARQTGRPNHYPHSSQYTDADTELLRSNYDRLRIAYELGRSLSATSKIGEILERIVASSFELLAAERAAILLVDPGTTELRPWLAKHRSGDSGAVTVSRTIVDEVMRSRLGVIVTDAGVDERFSSAASVVKEGIRSAMCVPMLHGDDLIGVMHLDSLVASGVFQSRDLDLFSTIASQAAVFIRSSFLMQEMQAEAKSRTQLERFLSPSLVDELATGELDAGQGGQLQDITVLFSDIRGFTSMSESMRPEDVFDMLNEYFEEMVEVLFRHGGTLDKYVGDELMALFGAPIPMPGSASSAVQCALEMLAVLDVCDRRWISRGRPPLNVGIGIHSGEAFCGPLGSSKSMQYTAIGDTVNTGARLCSAAAAGEIIISSTVQKVVARQFHLVELDPLKVKGKAEPLRTYRAVGVR